MFYWKEDKDKITGSIYELERMISRLNDRIIRLEETNQAMLKTAVNRAKAESEAPHGLKKDGTPRLEFTEGFDRAWREVGVNLDRSNFTVEDRNRSAGVYFVRYVNAKDVGDSKGFFTNLFSSKDDSKLQAKKYQVVVKSAGENSANVYVQDADGKPENTPAGIQLLTILTDQLTK